MSDEDTLHPVVFDTADPSQGFFARKLPPSSGDSSGGTSGSGSGGTTSTDGTRATVHVYDIPDFTSITPSTDGRSTIICPIKIPLSFATGDNKAPHRVSLLTNLQFGEPHDTPKNIDIDYICYRVTSIGLGPRTAFLTTSTNCVDNTITMPVAPQAIRPSLPVYIRGYKVADAPTNGYAWEFTSTLDFIICPNKMNSTGNGESTSLPVAGPASKSGIIRITQGTTTAKFGDANHTQIVQNFTGSDTIPYFDTLELVISGTVSKDTTVASANKIIMTVL